jgi:hypothetical protein
MRRMSASTALVALVLLAACTAMPPTSAAGIVTGRLLLEGGPSSANEPRPIPGTVQFTGHHRLVTVRVPGSGTFSVTLPAGTYQVAGSSPHDLEVSNGTTRQFPCSQPLSVTVTSRHTKTITLTCIVP